MRHVVRAPAGHAQPVLGEASEGAVEAPSDWLGDPGLASRRWDSTALEQASGERVESGAVVEVGPVVPELIIEEGAGGSPFRPEAVPPGAQVWRDPQGRVSAYCLSRAGTHWVDFPGVASFAFASDRSPVRAIPQPRATDEEVLDAYRRSVVPVLLQALGTEVLHASAVLTSRGVAAFCALAGTGKSTIAFGLEQRGYPAWADDALAVDVSTTPVKAIPLPFEIRLRPASVSYFGHNRYAASSRAARLGNGRVHGGAEPLFALCVLKRSTKAGVAVERVRPSLAFPSLLAHAYCFSLQDPEEKRRMIERYLGLSARVPIYQIEFEPGLEALPGILDAVEQMVDSGS